MQHAPVNVEDPSCHRLRAARSRGRRRPIYPWPPAGWPAPREDEKEGEKAREEEETIVEEEEEAEDEEVEAENMV